MSSEEENNLGFFEKISLKVKLIIGFLLGLVSFITVFMVSKKINARKILELELGKLETEIEIKNTEEDISKNKEEIDSLEKRAKKIKEEIELIKKGEKDEYVSKDQLDAFFDERGF